MIITPLKSLTADQIAALGTGPVSVEPYISQDYFAREMEQVFKRSWLFAAREEELPNVGDYLVRDYESSGKSAIFIRGKDDQIRAFYNVCSHRLVELVGDKRGRASNFTCRYHGWGYSLDGALRSIPDADGFVALDKANCGLQPVRFDSWAGFLFVNFDPEPRETLLEFLGPVASRLSEYPFSEFTTWCGVETELPVNWKGAMDNFQENYHLTFVHSKSLADRSTGDKNPFGNMLSTEFLGLHRMFGIWSNTEHLPTPVEAIAGRFGGALSTGAQFQTSAHERVRPKDWANDVIVLFPGYQILAGPGVYVTLEFLPIAVDRTRLVVRMFFRKASSIGARFSQEYSFAALRDTIAEDLTILRGQQKAMLSSGRNQVHFHSSEVMCRFNLKAVDYYINDENARCGAANLLEVLAS